MSTRLLCALPPLLLLSLGCQVVLGFEDFSGDTTTTSEGGAGAPSTSTTGSTACDLGDTKGAEMVLVSAYADGCLWIDATEVTRGQYQAFLDDAPNPDFQIDFCTWNASFQPDPECSQNDSVHANDQPESPAVCVDHCDALQYCAWAGKRLCDGAWTVLRDEAQDEWYAACSSNGENEYPYSGGYRPQACNDSGNQHGGCASNGPCTPAEVGAFSTCETPDGAADMAGNVAEWIDACSSTLGEQDTCYVRGGGVDDAADFANCDTASSPGRSHTHPALGFRCCAG